MQCSFIHLSKLSVEGEGGIYLLAATISFSFSTLAPVMSAILALFLKKMKVGMAVILYSAATSSQSSTSTFRTTTSLMVLEISSRWGAIILQGPHQVAKSPPQPTCLLQLPVG